MVDRGRALIRDSRPDPWKPFAEITRVSSGAGRRIITSAGTRSRSHSMSPLLRPCRGLSVAEMMMRSKCSCSRRWWSASRYVRPRATRASTCTPCELAPCSIASSSGMPTAHAAGRGASSGRVLGTRARNAGMIVAFSALARRTAASKARREMAWPVKGSRMRRTGRGRSRAARLPRGRSQKPAARPTARHTSAIAMVSPTLI